MLQAQMVEMVEMVFHLPSQVQVLPVQGAAEGALTAQILPVLEALAEAVQDPLGMEVKALHLEQQTQAEAEGAQPVEVQETLGPEVLVLLFSLFQQERVCHSLAV